MIYKFISQIRSYSSTASRNSDIDDLNNIAKEQSENSSILTPTNMAVGAIGVVAMCFYVIYRYTNGNKERDYSNNGNDEYTHNSLKGENAGTYGQTNVTHKKVKNNKVQGTKYTSNITLERNNKNSSSQSIKSNKSSSNESISSDEDDFLFNFRMKQINEYVEEINEYEELLLDYNSAAQKDTEYIVTRCKPFITDKIQKTQSIVSQEKLPEYQEKITDLFSKLPPDTNLETIEQCELCQQELIKIIDEQIKICETNIAGLEKHKTENKNKINKLNDTVQELNEKVYKLAEDLYSSLDKTEIQRKEIISMEIRFLKDDISSMLQDYINITKDELSRGAYKSLYNSLCFYQEVIAQSREKINNESLSGDKEMLAIIDEIIKLNCENLNCRKEMLDISEQIEYKSDEQISDQTNKQGKLISIKDDVIDISFWGCTLTENKERFQNRVVIMNDVSRLLEEIKIKYDKALSELKAIKEEMEQDKQAYNYQNHKTMRNGIIEKLREEFQDFRDKWMQYTKNIYM